MRIALAQMRSGIDPARNIAAIASNARAAAEAGAALITTPEMAVQLDRDRNRARQGFADVNGQPWVARLSEIARQNGLALHVGSLPVPTADGRLANRSLFFAPDGELAATYDKLHLFDVSLDTGESWRESASYAGGERAVVVETEQACIGLTICYDLRFPELFAALGLAGAGLILVPAAFTVPTGRAHWEVLLRARAIETGCYIVAAAQVGTHEDGRTTYGHSLVVNPWGEVMLDMGEEPGVAVIELDLSASDVARRQLPSLQHRRAIPSVSRHRMPAGVRG